MWFTLHSLWTCAVLALKTHSQIHVFTSNSLLPELDFCWYHDSHSTCLGGSCAWAPPLSRLCLQKANQVVAPPPEMLRTTPIGYETWPLDRPHNFSPAFFPWESLRGALFTKLEHLIGTDLIYCINRETRYWGMGTFHKVHGNHLKKQKISDSQVLTLSATWTL